jgi:hypothetical protein
VSYLLDIDLSEMEKALNKQLGRKPKALALNVGALKGRLRLRPGHLRVQGGVPRRADDANEGKLLIEGNARRPSGV